MRPTREQIITKFQECAQTLGKVPGRLLFLRQTNLKERDWLYFWPKFSDLVRESGFEPNEFSLATPDDDLWQAMAQVCLRLKKYPTQNEYRIVSREMTLPGDSVYTARYGRTADIKQHFRQWLQDGPEEFRCILDFPGWETVNRTTQKQLPTAAAIPSSSRNHPFLPICLQPLELLSYGRKPSEDFQENVNMAFERRCAVAFRCLGFDVQDLGQGRGRKADCLALARVEGFGVIIDAKVRANGYVLGTEDRKFLEYATTHSRELELTGIQKVYLVVVGSEFRNDDLKKLTEYLADSPVRGAVFITAKALMRIVEESIRERHRFRLADIDKLLFSNKVISD